MAKRSACKTVARRIVILNGCLSFFVGILVHLGSIKYVFKINPVFFACDFFCVFLKDWYCVLLG